MAAAIGYLKASSPAECVAHIEAWVKAPHPEVGCLPRAGGGTLPAGVEPPSPNDVRQVLDFFEELGSAYNEELIDLNVFKRTIGAVTVGFLADGWWFVVWRRKGLPAADAPVYAELEAMARDVRNEREDLREKHQPAPVRVLALTRKDATAGEWERCGRLADALSARFGTLRARSAEATDALIEEIAAAGAGVGDAGAPRTPITLHAVPDDLGDDGDAWDAQRLLVRRIEQTLATMSPAGVEAVVEALGVRPASP